VAEVTLERRDNVALITLTAPNRRNAFTAPMVAELLAICDEVDADLGFGAAVIRGEGESFCSGAHRDILKEAGKDPMHPDRYAAIGATYDAFFRVGNLKVPTIAAVRGHAVGAGVNLLLATDLRVVAEDARIMTGFARIGIHPGGGHFALLGRLAGREAAAAMSVFGLEVSGRRAVELGLAWEAIPAEQVEGRAFQIASDIARDPELARQTVRSFRLELGPPELAWAAAVEAERAVQAWSLRRREVRGEPA
jgi:enoyl-CoA hydratase